MNLLIGFVILLCLLCSELRAPVTVGDCWTQTLMVGLVAMTVPGLALFQTLIVSRRFRDTSLPADQRQAAIGRISACHSAVWLTASLAIIWSVRWQDVVRESWQMDRWPLVDEALILAPVVLSLVASWAIFFEVQRTIDGADGKRFTLQGFKNRWGYVAIRIRVYFLMTLIPISLAVLSRDLAPWLERIGPTQSIVVYAVAVFAIMLGFPLLLLIVWQNKRIDDNDLRSELIDTCRAHQLFIYDVRIWRTGNRIVNALVAGIVPRFRVVLLSDSLVKLFPRNELLAIVRHEAGHLRLWHLPIRIGFFVLPLVALAVDEQNPLGVLTTLDTVLVKNGLPFGSAIALAVAVYIAYALVSLSWLSRRMEFEADIYACQTCPQGRHVVSIDQDLSRDMSDALLRLAAVTPSLFERRTLTHPSIRERLKVIREIQESPDKALRFRRSFIRRRRLALAVLCLICFLTLVA